MNLPKPLLVSVVGPTAVGKTDFTIKLASYFGSEIISVDSRQFYKEMEIGTAKPSNEELETVPHHLINSHQIHEEVSAGHFEKMAIDLLDKLYQKYRVVFAVGGTGLYFKALWQGLDPVPDVDHQIRKELNHQFEKDGLHFMLEELKAKDIDYFNQVDQRNPQRIIRALEVIRSSGKAFSSFKGKERGVVRNFRNIKIGLKLDRETLYDRINNRMDHMIEMGLFEEAERLYPFRDYNALQTVGYKEIFDYMDEKYDKEECIRLLKRNSRRYAKRQLTWFRQEEDIIWLDPQEIDLAIQRVNEKLSI